MASSLEGYQVIVHPASLLDVENAGFWTEVVELPICIAEGATVDEAVEKTRQAISKWMALHSEGNSAPSQEINIKVILAV